MISSSRLNSLNVRIHDLVRENPDVSEWAYSGELHSLLAQRHNLITQQLLYRHYNARELKRTLEDYTK